MMESLKSLTEIPDLRKRILYTLLMLAVYRLGSFVPTPGINSEVFQRAFSQFGGTLFGLLSMFSGGSLNRLTVFALGIMPYITASIILQLLGVVSPTLEKLQKEGELGRKKITEYTRWMTVGLSAFQAFGIAVALQRETSANMPLVNHPGLGFTLSTVLTLTTGAVFVMWLGEQITARGIGNGMSLLIFAGIVVGLPAAIGNLYENVFVTRVWSFPIVLLLLAFMLVVVAFIVLVERGERRIPIQYAKRIVGRKVLGGVSTHLPLKVNSGGVMPIIFAVSILTFPQTIALFAGTQGTFGTGTYMVQDSFWLGRTTLHNNLRYSYYLFCAFLSFDYL
ncbi:MAG: preprotein translocase subunit SecY [Acidobacteria bacterium]|nr:preprotein translocase subunit SecY [Acidobacteriota bacterium]